MKKLFSVFLTLTACVLYVELTTGPCTNYDNIENEEKRSSSYIYDFDTDIAISDDVLQEGWYRIISRSGTDMPTEPPATFRCGTWYPIWLNGSLPSVDDGVVTRKVCTRTFTDFCEDFWNIDIKNCTDFYVYNLKTSKRAKSAYCFGTGGVQCPMGESSYNGYYPGCTNTGFPTAEIIPHVVSTLDDGPPANPDESKIPSLVVVFQCMFDQVSNYVYDVYWYINEYYVTEHNNKLYSSIRQTDLRPDDWVGNHYMNMIVRCSVRLRNGAESLPGPYYDSNWFKAGLYPDQFQYQVIESESTIISYTATVPVGCFRADQVSHCNHLLYVTQPKYQNVPTTCSSSNILQQDIAFDSFQSCGLTVPSQYSGQSIQFNVTGYVDGQYSGSRKRSTKIRLMSLISTVDLTGAWNNITSPDIEILVSDADEKMKNRLCRVFNDPHFWTADRTRYDYYGVGEYILYKNTKYPYQVNALFTKCGSASCNCGVAIQAGQSLFVLRICKNISKKVKYVRGLSTPFVDKRICDDKSMVIEENTSSGIYDVTLSIGTTVSFKVSGEYIRYITVKPSVLDLGSAEGLCGYISSENGQRDDDLRKRNETEATTSIEDFAKSWEVTGTSESLFAENPPVLSYENSLQSYCTCANVGGPQGGITDNYFLHCNLSQPMEACYDVQTDLSLDTRCSDGNRKKRSASDPLKRVIRSTDDTDDVIDFTPLTFSENVFNDSVPHEVPKWSNGWTYELAESTCREYINERFPHDLSDITGEYPDDYIGTCVDDIKAAGDTSFMSTTLDTMLTAAKVELERNQTLKEETTEDGRTLLEKLTSLLCLNNCSSNGNCINGICVCNSMFGGEDCSKSRTTAPTNISVPELGLCQSRTRSCKKTNVMGHFMPPDVWCNIQHFEILENNISYTGSPTISKADIKHSYMVSCEFANARRKRSTSNTTVFADGYEISLSNDGSNYGEVVTLIVYDEECYSCNTVNVTCTAIETCPLTRTEQTESGKVRNEENDENNVVLPISIIAGLIVLAALIGFIVYKIKHKDIGHRQINTSAKGEQPGDLLSYDFATQNIPPKLNELDQMQTPHLTKEYSSASSFSVELNSVERRTPDHLFLVDNKYN
ncbi:uncharacterized protein LOC127702954 isoform X1 [Mytilus californianus]|uniref:uncharacterized protein LOC127702954 isoform X1 n=1 Tax=Mytilus californianus TaxID=6549 RepID=UPI00224854CB|nr:uncharacterized protein LOC127702954 isoform X1 [Mytilus californianus]